MLKNDYPDVILLDSAEHNFLDFSNDNFPSILKSWTSEPLGLQTGHTHFGFVYSGTIDLELPGQKKYSLDRGMYFSVNTGAVIKPKKEASTGFIVSRCNYHGFFSIGGPVESRGRYRYIDGCSDSLLLSPVLKGDPCFNLLYFPAGIRQTQHTHPSLRIGMITGGSGECILKDRVLPLQAGQLFVIKPDVLHSFKTDESDMTVVVYHPESDFGPTDQNHPMINKTFINGVSASLLNI